MQPPRHLSLSSFTDSSPTPYHMKPFWSPAQPRANYWSIYQQFSHSTKSVPPSCPGRSGWCWAPSTWTIAANTCCDNCWHCWCFPARNPGGVTCLSPEQLDDWGIVPLLLDWVRILLVWRLGLRPCWIIGPN